MKFLPESLIRAIRYGSPEINPVTGKRIQKRARSPSPQPLTQEEIDQRILETRAQHLATQQQEIYRQEALLRVEALQFMHNHDVIEIINSINEYLTSFFGEGVNVEDEDPSIRYIVGMIVTSNNFRISAAQKLRRSRLLLQAVVNVIINRVRTCAGGFGNVVERLLPVIRTGIENAGRFLFQVGATTGRVAYNAVYNVASSIRSNASRSLVEEVPGRAASSPPRQQYMYHEMASAAVESVAAGLPAFYGALTSVLGRVYDLLAQCGAAGASVVASVVSRGFKRLRAMCSTPEQAVARAVVQVVPQEQQQDSECAICMTAANFINEHDVNYGPLGYVEKHRNGAPGHPDMFHQLCLLACPGNKCPMCRAEGPVWGTKRPPGQGGGGLKKYRSKSKSKSRRYISKPQKSRKARKRVRHASSRRK